MAGVAEHGNPARLAIGAVLLASLVVLGGSGSPSPDVEAVVQLLALVAAAAAIASGLRPLGLLRGDPVWAWLVLAILSFPLVQLLPLPAAWWHALPGRQAALAALDATGQGSGWRAWSLLPDGGTAAALALVPAAVITLVMADLAAAARVRLIGCLAVLGLAAALLGLLQFARGPDRLLSLYPTGHVGWAIGFFANRNAQADLLAIGLTATILLADRHRRGIATGAVRLVAGMAALVMLLSGVAAGSRMGMVSLAVPVLLAISLAGRRAPWLASGLALGTALLLVGGTALDRVAARAQDTGNRVEIWGDSLFVAWSVAPVGGGMGSFQPLYAAAERLDHVQPTIANRAHNDYLELAIEGGLPALALGVAVLALVARRALRGWHARDPDERLLARFAGLTALILALHSTVDYPLRTLTLLGIAGLALGGVATCRARFQGANGERAGVLGGA